MLQIGELYVFDTVFNCELPDITQIARHPRFPAALRLLSRFQVWMLMKDPIRLKDDPDGPVPYFSIRHAPEMRAKFLGTRAKNFFCTIEWYAAYEEN